MIFEQTLKIGHGPGIADPQAVFGQTLVAAVRAPVVVLAANDQELVIDEGGLGMDRAGKGPNLDPVAQTAGSQPGRRPAGCP